MFPLRNAAEVSKHVLCKSTGQTECSRVKRFISSMSFLKGSSVAELFSLCLWLTAWLDWQMKKIYSWTISNGCLQYTYFQLFCLESSTVSSETGVSCMWTTEITSIINQPILQVFSIFIRHVSLLQCLIAILWLDLKIAWFEFLSCVFKYIRKGDLFSY